jgi:hypothetical protein
MGESVKTNHRAARALDAFYVASRGHHADIGALRLASDTRMRRPSIAIRTAMRAPLSYLSARITSLRWQRSGRIGH